MNEALLNWTSTSIPKGALPWLSAMPALLLVLALFGSMVAFALRNWLRGPYRDTEMERRGLNWPLGIWLRRWFSWILKPVMALLLKTRLPATAVTTSALLFATAAGAAIAAGHMAMGGWLFLSSGVCDVLDGRIARTLDTASPAGAVLDSVVDRYVDGIVLLGLAWYYRTSWVLVAVVLALMGSLIVPYVRARSESLGVNLADVGLARRSERVIVLGLSMALSPLVEAALAPNDPQPSYRLAIIGILTVAVTSHVTVLQRLFFAQRSLRSAPAAARGVPEVGTPDDGATPSLLPQGQHGVALPHFPLRQGRH